MKRRRVGVSKVFLAGEVLGCLLLVAQVNVARAQTEAVSAVVGLPDDWTHRHVLFPDSLFPDVGEAVQREPRYWLHQARRKGEAPVSTAWSREIPLRGDRSKKKRRKALLANKTPRVFHALAPDVGGTAGSPGAPPCNGTDPPPPAVPATHNSAVDVKISYGATGDSSSPPWVDYVDDVAYVGADDG